MSATQVQKLQTLLARVQSRRHEPRLVAVGVAAPSANQNLATPTLELAKPLASIEDAIAPKIPSSLPPPRVPSSIPPPSSVPPAVSRSPMPAKPSTSTVPPSQTVLGRANTEVLPAVEPPAAAAVRVASSPALPFDSAVRVASSPRIEAPKSFGDLLELSLALRPKTG